MFHKPPRGRGLSTQGALYSMGSTLRNSITASFIVNCTKHYT